MPVCGGDTVGNVRPKLVRGRFAAGDAARFEKARLAPARGVFGGEVAADRLTGQLKPTRVTLYVWAAPEDVILANRLRPDERGAVEILDPGRGKREDPAVDGEWEGR